jgi:hypothetical protein
MKIPKKVKVGGKTYYIEITENISLGINYVAEINYEKLKINIRPSVQERMEHDFLHELVHAIFDFNGYKDHDEELIDRTASALHMLIRDNPGLFSDVLEEVTRDNECLSNN